MYTVTLSSCGNIDYGQNPYTPYENTPNMEVTAETIEQCQQFVQEYIDEYNLGSGNWSGGEIYDEKKNYIGKISYNGRFIKNRNMIETLKENIERTDNCRIQTIRLIELSGELIEEGDKEYIVQKYGDRYYSNGYSDGNGKVSIWVI